MRTFLYVMAFFVTALGIAFSVLWGLDRLPPAILENLRIVLGIPVSVVVGLVLLALGAAIGASGSPTDGARTGRERATGPTGMGRKTEVMPGGPVSEEPQAQQQEQQQNADDDIFLVNPLDE